MNNCISIGDLISFKLLRKRDTIMGIVLKVDWAWSDLFINKDKNTSIRVALLTVYSEGKIESVTSLDVTIINSV